MIFGPEILILPTSFGYHTCDRNDCEKYSYICKAMLIDFHIRNSPLLPQFAAMLFSAVRRGCSKRRGQAGLLSAGRVSCAFTIPQTPNRELASGIGFVGECGAGPDLAFVVAKIDGFAGVAVGENECVPKAEEGGQSGEDECGGLHCTVMASIKFGRVCFAWIK